MSRFINLRNSKTRMIILAFVDIITMIVNSYLSLILRYEGHYTWISREYIVSIQSYMVINIITTLVIFLILNLYNSVWSFASVHEAVMIVAACVLSTAFQALGMQFLMLHVPRSYYVFYLFFMVTTTIATRFSYRALGILRQGIRKTEGKIVNTMVIGAGEAGSIIIQELKSSKYLNRKVVCIIDDNPSKRGKYLHGIKIAGNRNEIVYLAEKYNVQEIILAIPSATAKDTRDILRICNKTSCKLKVLPGIYQLITEEVSVSKLREVSIEDLLGRDIIDIDITSVYNHINNQVILVTGGGGSIGSELCRQIARHNPKLLIIFDIYENNAYDIEQELKANYPKLNLKVLIGSVRDSKRINWVFETYKPDIVIYDVLGDVVCGGFAMPIRGGYAKDVYVVSSGEMMSLYAANNIASAIRNFGKRGYARLRGLVLNAKNIENEREIVEKAVQEIGTQIVCYVPRSSEIQEAENQGGTVFEFLTDSVMQGVYNELADRILADA